MSNIKQKVIVIFGPTSSGKTELSIKIAKYIYGKYHIECELISADSRQVYQDMDVGTNKVTNSLRNKYPHHLIDKIPPSQGYNSDRFKEEATSLIKEIFARDNLPIIVGGTGTFIMSLVGDRFLISSSIPDKLSYDVLFLVPQFERQRLYRRIEKTVDEMFKNGLYAEIKKIVNKYSEVPEQVKRTHGYREFIELSSKERKSLFKLNSQDLEIIKRKIKSHTKKYAMHQSAWLNKIHGYYVVSDIENLKKKIDQFLKN